MTATKDRVLIILSTGRQDGGAKATLAFSWGCSALSLGSDVLMFATMDGTIWGLKDACAGIQMHGFEPLETYVQQYLDLGGKLCICPPCLEYYCTVDEPTANKGLRDRAEVCGIASSLAHISEYGKVLTF
jgi:predicted peroxiredoxin